ncbi:MAG: YIP1 family protein [Ignavibacteria bacterium]|nr:YIP1 family protein [Ignavibacteria bacterium]
MENEFQQPENAEPKVQLSYTDAVSGIVMSPGETFETIDTTPKRNYWLISILICIVLGLISSFLFLNDNELVDKIIDKQKEKLHQTMDEGVKSGKMSQEEANIAIEQAEKFMNPEGLFFKISAFGGSVITPFITMLVFSLIGIIIIKILKGNFMYLNLLNVISLSMIIAAAGDLINMFVSVLTGDITSVGLAPLLKSSGIPESINIALINLNVFKIWSLAVMSIGIAKIGKVKIMPVMIIIFAVYIIYSFITASFQQ